MGARGPQRLDRARRRPARLRSDRLRRRRPPARLRGRPRAQDPAVIVPLLPGHFSALGMLLADIRHEQVRTIYATLDDIAADELSSVAQEMSDEARGAARPPSASPRRDQEVELFCDLRYRGPGIHPAYAGHRRRAEVTTAAWRRCGQRFDELHELRFGHSRPASPVEVVNLRVVGIGRRERFSPTLGRSTGRRRRDHPPRRVGHRQPRQRHGLEHLPARAACPSATR